jgi:hypothetical protein
VAACTYHLYTPFPGITILNSFREDASNRAPVSSHYSSEIIHRVRCRFFRSNEPVGNLFTNRYIVDMEEM